MRPVSQPLITCYVLRSVTCKNGPISICGCKLPLSECDTSRFYGTSLGGCYDVAATTKTWFSQKVNAQHPLEISREQSSKNLVACSQPETSSLHNIGSEVDGFLRPTANAPRPLFTRRHFTRAIFFLATWYCPLYG